MDMTTTVGLVTTGLILFGIKAIIAQIPALWLLALNAGHTKRTWLLCFVDASLNLLVIAKAISTVQTHPVITFFYAGGFATGMVLGMKLSPYIDRLATRWKDDDGPDSEDVPGT